MVDVRPCRQKYRWWQRTPVRYRSLTAVHGIHRPQQSLIQLEVHKLRNGIKRLMLKRITEIEGVIDLRHADVDVQPLQRLVRWIINTVRMTHAVRHTRRTLNQRGAAIDSKLRLAIQDHEHFFAPVMEVLAYPTVRVDYAAMEEDKVRFHSVCTQHHAEAH